MGEEQLHLTVLYSLYRYAERINKYNFTVSEIYDKSALEGPYKLFGINRKTLEGVLRGLSTKYGHDWITCELMADLDNIHLNENKKSVDIVKLYADNKWNQWKLQKVWGGMVILEQEKNGLKTSF